jgi:hypothetical protein
VDGGQTLLVIADIGGYTDFMRLHRTSLAHAEVTTGRLLRRIVEAARGFELIEIEGDAAFLARPVGDHAPFATTTDVAVAMHRAFHAERLLVATNMCPCEGCALAGELTLKFVAHVGDVATQTIEKRTKLVGIDVILVHRLLKNPVAVPEYVLVSDQLYGSADAELAAPVHEVSQDLEGIGTVRAFYVDVEDLGEPGFAQKAPPPTTTRLAETVGLLVRGLPYMTGLRRRRCLVADH